jgi:hypothetical protein
MALSFYLYTKKNILNFCERDSLILYFYDRNFLGNKKLYLTLIIININLNFT